MAAGGHGAPLAPAWHFELLRDGDLPAVFLNIGGVSNLTYILKDCRDSMRAFDCGPGNGPLDAWVQHCGMGHMDIDGQISSAGQVDAGLLTQALKAMPVPDGPASFDRWDFDWHFMHGLTQENGAATLAAITIHAIARAVLALSPAPNLLLVGGGGRLNPTIMAGLRAQLSMPVKPCEAIGLDGDAIEAQAFAWLAALKQAELPGSWPGTTGVRSPVVGGITCDPSSWSP